MTGFIVFNFGYFGFAICHLRFTTRGWLMGSCNLQWCTRIGAMNLRLLGRTAGFPPAAARAGDDARWVRSCAADSTRCGSRVGGIRAPGGRFMGSCHEFRTRAHWPMNRGRFHLTRFRLRWRESKPPSPPQSGGEGPSGEGGVMERLYPCFGGTGCDLLAARSPCW